MKALDKFDAVRARSSLRSLFLIVACWMAICAVHGQEPTTAALEQSKQRLTTKDPATAQKSDTVSTDPLAELGDVQADLPKDTAVKAVPPSVEAVPAPKTGATIHVVKPGETLFRISRRYGVDVEKLKKMNKLPDDIIEVGQKLIVGTE